VTHASEYFFNLTRTPAMVFLVVGAVLYLVSHWKRAAKKMQKSADEAIDAVEDRCDGYPHKKRELYLTGQLVILNKCFWRSLGNRLSDQLQWQVFKFFESNTRLSPIQFFATFSKLCVKPGLYCWIAIDRH